MKIGILSMQRVINYGSVLQAWSLREMVRQATGATAEFIDIEDSPALESLAGNAEAEEYAPKAAMSRTLLQRGKRWCFTRLSRRNKAMIRRFMRDELHLDAPGSECLDCAVIGSDEVFNHVRGVRLQLHGEVRRADRVITYAASCGSARPEHIRTEDAPRVRQAMQRLSAVSVRDDATAHYASELYDGPIQMHMDPVLMGPLHARKARKVPLKKYLLVYAYGQRIRTEAEISAIQAYAKAHGLKTVAMGGTQFWCDLFVPAPPMRMLDWFAHADCVVTDTFHGAVFSVITKRRFAAIVRPSNRGKLNCLLAQLGLADRSVGEMAQLAAILDAPVDHDGVEHILARERQRAQAYLKEQLNDEQGTHPPV